MYSKYCWENLILVEKCLPCIKISYEDSRMTEKLEGLAKTIYEEVMDEIKEEIGEGLGDVIAVEKLKAITVDIQKAVKEKITKLILKHTKDDMTEIEKMVLGEKLSRVVTKKAKEVFATLVSEVVEKTYETMYELRNEIIEEVFEETKIEEEEEEEKE
jgi:hypothetical protein